MAAVLIMHTPECTRPMEGTTYSGEGENSGGLTRYGMKGANMLASNPSKWAVSALFIAMFMLSSATGALSQSAAVVQNAIGILTDTSNSPQERIAAARDLGALAQDSDSAVQALIAALSNDPNPAVRSAATSAIGSAAFPSASPIEALIQALGSDSSSEVRRTAVEGLSIIGVDSASALQALQNAAKNDPDPGVRQAALAVYNRFSSN
jgi:HEAT repeat protein